MRYYLLTNRKTCHFKQIAVLCVHLINVSVFVINIAAFFHQCFRSMELKIHLNNEPRPLFTLFHVITHAKDEYWYYDFFLEMKTKTDADSFEAILIVFVHFLLKQILSMVFIMKKLCMRQLQPSSTHGCVLTLFEFDQSAKILERMLAFWDWTSARINLLVDDSTEFCLSQTNIRPFSVSPLFLCMYMSVFGLCVCVFKNHNFVERNKFLRWNWKKIVFCKANVFVCISGAFGECKKNHETWFRKNAFSCE